MKQVKSVLIDWSQSGRISMKTFRRALQECDTMEQFEELGTLEAIACATLIVGTIT